MSQPIPFPAAEAIPAPETRAELPRHIAVVMDGNGRWARRRGWPRIAGHRRGVVAAKNIVSLAGKRGIPYLTLFAFSSENWQRPHQEVALLLELLATSLQREIATLQAHKIRLRVIGDCSRFPPPLQRQIADAVEQTRANAALHLTIAINYGGRWDIAQACRAVADLVARNQIAADAVTAGLLESHLCTRDLPAPDLFIRTGGEQRISNFLLWQLAYTELYFTDAYWPEFDATELDQALRFFAQRRRRFGRTDEQIQAQFA